MGTGKALFNKLVHQLFNGLSNSIYETLDIKRADIIYNI